MSNLYQRTGSTWSPVDLGKLVESDDPAPVPTMLHRTDGAALLYPGAIHSCQGEPESMKTWFASKAAVEELALGHVVVFLDFEDSADTIVRRLKALGAKKDSLRMAQFIYVRPEGSLDEVERQDLGSILSLEPSLVLVDGVSEAMMLMGCDMNSNRDVARFRRDLPRWIADRGPAVLMTDHVAKSSDARNRYAIGGMHKLAGLTGAAFSMQVLNNVRKGAGPNGEGRVNLMLTKDRPGELTRLAVGNQRVVADMRVRSMADGSVEVELLPVDPGAVSISAGGLDATKAQVLRYLTDHPNAKVGELERAVGGNKVRLKQVCDALVTEKRIERVAGPRGSILHSIVDQPSTAA